MESSRNHGGNVRDALLKAKIKHNVNVVETLGKPSAKHSGNPSGNMVEESHLLVNPLQDIQPRSSFKLLSKTQQIIANLIYVRCKLIREEFTEAVQSRYLIEACRGASINTIRSAVADLKNLRIIDKRLWKGGPSGWTDYWLNPTSYRELIELESTGKLSEILVETLWNPNGNPSGKPSGLALSSSSSKNTNTTDTREPESSKPGLPDEWKTGVGWTALEKHFGPVSHNEKMGVYRSQLDLPANEDLKDSAPLTMESIQNSIDRMTWDYEHKLYTADSTYLVRSRLFGILNKRGNYTAQAPGFKTRKAREAEQLQKELEEESRLIRASQDARFELVQMKWIHAQNLEEHRKRYPGYAIAKSEERLKGMIQTHFRQQNYSKITQGGITDVSELRIDYDKLD